VIPPFPVTKRLPELKALLAEIFLHALSASGILWPDTRHDSVQPNMMKAMIYRHRRGDGHDAMSCESLVDPST
jgi:hypothetical protein